MKKPILEQLRRKYPDIFGEGNMYIACSDMWYELVDGLCFLIQAHVSDKNRKYEEQYSKRAPSLLPVKMNKMICNELKVEEVSEGLRHGISGADEYIRGLLRMAESTSQKFYKHRKSV